MIHGQETPLRIDSTPTITWFATKQELNLFLQVLRIDYWTQLLVFAEVIVMGANHAKNDEWQTRKASQKSSKEGFSFQKRSMILLTQMPDVIFHTDQGWVEGRTSLWKERNAWEVPCPFVSWKHSSEIIAGIESIYWGACEEGSWKSRDLPSWVLVWKPERSIDCALHRSFLPPKQKWMLDLRSHPIWCDL